MKKTKIIALTLFVVFFCCEWASAQNTSDDYNDDLYLAIRGIDYGSLCGYDSPNYQPGDVFQYQTHVWTDLYKLYNIAYRRNTFFNGNLTYWTTFGGYGNSDPEHYGEPFSGCIDDNKKTYVARGTFNVGLLKFANVRVPGPSNTGTNKWGTTIWINVFSQCHNQCSQGTWWKFEKELSYDEAIQFAITHDHPDFTDSYVNGTSVILTHKGNPSCDPTAVFGCGANESK